MIKKNDKIFLAGHKGLVGSAVLRLFKEKGYKNIITKDRKDLNLFDQRKVLLFLKKRSAKLKSHIHLVIKLEKFHHIPSH